MKPVEEFSFLKILCYKSKQPTAVEVGGLLAYFGFPRGKST